MGFQERGYSSPLREGVLALLQKQPDMIGQVEAPVGFIAAPERYHRFAGVRTHHHVVVSDTLHQPSLVAERKATAGPILPYEFLV